MTDLTGSDFGTSDGTFKAVQRDNEVHFDLGFQKRQKKRAIYKNGTVTVDIRSSEPQGTLPKNECAAVLNMIVTCVRLPEDRKSTRLNSSHLGISYAVFCLKKKIK